MTLVVACLGLVVVMASMTSLYTALPSIGTDTGASQEDLTWITDAYTVVLATLLLPFGAVADSLGRRLLLQAGFALFVVSSLVPLLADSPGALIATRALMGVGAAMVLPPTLSLITATLHSGRRTQGVALWAVFATVGGMLGVLATGGLLEAFSWRAAFVGPAALAAVGLLLSPLAVESRDPSPGRFDWPGAVLSGLSIGVGVLGVLEAPIRGWRDGLVLACLLLSAVAGAVFVRVELRAQAPLLDVRFFAVPDFATGALSTMIQFLAVYGALLVVAQHLQLVLGWSPLGAGVVICAIAPLLLVLAVVAGRLRARTGLRAVTLLGMAVLLAGLAVLATVDAQSGTARVAWGLLVLGAGVGLLAPTGTSGIVDSVPAAQQGVASAVNDTTREVGAALGIALAGSLLAAGYQAGVRDGVAGLPDGLRDPAQESLAGAAEVAAGLGPVGQDLLAAARVAFTDGLSEAMVGLAVVVLALNALVVLVAPDRHGRALRGRRRAVPAEPVGRALPVAGAVEQA